MVLSEDENDNIKLSRTPEREGADVGSDELQPDKTSVRAPQQSWSYFETHVDLSSGSAG